MADMVQKPDSGSETPAVTLGSSSTAQPDYFELVFQCAPIGMCLVELDGTFMSANRAMCAMLGHTEAELLGRTVMDITVDADVEFTRDQLEQLARQRAHNSQFEKRYRHKLGHEVWGSVTVHVHCDETGSPAFFITHIQDITERKRAEAIRVENEEKFRIAFENAPMGMSIIGPTGQYLAVNPALCSMFGYSREELLAGTLHHITHPDDIERGNDWIRKRIAGDDSEPELEKRYIHRDGHVVWGLVRAGWVRNPDGTPKMSIAHVLDITARKRAEQDLMARERELREAHRIAKMGHWQYDIDADVMTWADNLYEILEYSHEVQPSLQQYLARVHPDDRDSVLQTHGRSRDQSESTDLLHRLRFPDQRIKHVRGITRTERAQAGQSARVVGIIQDVTELREAELQRGKLEAQLHQAQKMEAVGYLAGGIAHDFNNLLTAIGGNASLALMDTAPQATTHESLSEILKGVESAAELTRQLLTFSRKQVIAPRVVNLNDVVRHLSSMLKRLLGEDLQFMTCLDPQLGQVRIDLSQAEQILVNLAVNARDAMELGGKLTVETLNVELDETYCRSHPNTHPGPFVMLAVSDNGAGMSPETKQHIFEPFFTTKAHGQGTGLGLAMVYGAVLQNSGIIEVYSELGRGTTFKIYLPRVDALAEAIEPTQQLASTLGHETIIVVEDDEKVRSLCARVLRRQGYTVHAFRNGEDALEAIRTLDRTVHLVITDVVMPGMNGRVFADRVQKLFPRLRVLYTSGYTQNVIAHHGILEPGISFLAKPYSYQSLAKRVRELLDEGG